MHSPHDGENHFHALSEGVCYFNKCFARGTVRYCIWYCTVLYGTVRYCTVLYLVLYGIVRYCTAPLQVVRLPNHRGQAGLRGFDFSFDTSKLPKRDHYPPSLQRMVSELPRRLSLFSVRHLGGIPGIIPGIILC